ncbi:MAG: helix-turn-helix transcriptional regulator [Lentisphaeria bacterium]|nr:helix-turn-helix transcriptional regulator [Lentisphaeria bacterium]
MAFVFLKAEKLKRSTSFPAKVSRLYACDWKRFRVSEQDYIYGQQEITIRYDSDSKGCMDKINGQVMGIPFPNVVFKFPGMKIRIADDSPRSVIGFSYSGEVIELLRSWGMFPDELFLPLPASAELKRLIGEFQKFTRDYPTLNCPGDRIDGICFGILREIMLSRQGSRIRNRTPEIRIKEVELFFRHHYDEKLDLDTVAEQFGFSHASFYQYWKKTYHTTPHRYVDGLKLRAAAFSLLHSSQSLAAIAEGLQFPGASSFHRKFREYFHTTPAAFRRDREHWEKELSNFMAE